MLTLLLQLVSIFLSSLVLTYLYRKYAVHKAILDLPCERSSHNVPTPTGGGLAISLTLYSGLVLLFINGQINNDLFMALFCALPISAIGYIDDLRGLRANIRSLVQICCTLIALYILGGLHYFDLGFIRINWVWFLSILSVLGIIWSINLFNFLDGIDGYIGSEIIFIGLSFFLFTKDLPPLLMAIAVLGFLFWNWPKAKIFMGDVGSTSLGFIVAILAIHYQNENQVPIIVSLILTSVFWFDATVTLIRRIINKETLNVAHKKHAYQRIVQSGFSHQKTVLLTFVINLIGFGLACLAMKYKSWNWLFLILDLILLIGVLRYIDNKKAFEYSK